LIENKMGYRGSKSVLAFNIVKEQRVDGNWGLFKIINNKCIIIKIKPLRCTLMDYESSYLVKILTKQLNSLFYCKFSVNIKLKK